MGGVVRVMWGYGGIDGLLGVGYDKICGVDRVVW